MADINEMKINLMRPYQVGYDLDDDIIDVLDNLILNIDQDEDLKKLFAKHRFLRSLKGHLETPGPIRQLIEKTAKIEQEQTKLFTAMREMREAIKELQDGEKE
jgi:hypothetical protein